MTLALLAQTGSAHALASLSFTDTPNADTEFLAWAAANNFVESFVAEGRFGNNSASGGDWEIDLYPANTGPDTSLQFSWPNNVPLDFSLVYDGASLLATFQVSGTQDTLSIVGLPGQPLNTLAFRKQDPIDGATFINITNFEVDGVTQPNPSFVGGFGTEYFVIPGAGALDDGFTLEGTVAFQFDDPANARGSRQAFQIKLGNSTAPPVPEPATVGLLLGAVALGGAWLRRRLRKD